MANSHVSVLYSRQYRDIPPVIEQPCDSLAELQAARKHITHPLTIDESATDLSRVLSAVETNLVDGFGMKLTRLVRFTDMSTFREICEITHPPHTVDDPHGGDSIAASCVQLATTVKPQLLDGVWIAAPCIDGHYDESNPVAVSAGYIEVPTGHGRCTDAGKFNQPLNTFGYNRNDQSGIFRS